MLTIFLQLLGTDRDQIVDIECLSVHSWAKPGHGQLIGALGALSSGTSRGLTVEHAQAIRLHGLHLL